MITKICAKWSYFVAWSTIKLGVRRPEFNLVNYEGNTSYKMGKMMQIYYATPKRNLEINDFDMPLWKPGPKIAQL